jgi:hypothetical protein
VLKAVGERKLAWLQRYGQPCLPEESFYQEIYNYQKVEAKAQIQNLMDYLNLASYCWKLVGMINLVVDQIACSIEYATGAEELSIGVVPSRDHEPRGCFLTPTWVQDEENPVIATVRRPSTIAMIANWT